MHESLSAFYFLMEGRFSSEKQWRKLGRSRGRCGSSDEFLVHRWVTVASCTLVSSFKLGTLMPFTWGYLEHRQVSFDTSTLQSISHYSKIRNWNITKDFHHCMRGWRKMERDGQSQEGPPHSLLHLETIWRCSLGAQSFTSDLSLPQEIEEDARKWWKGISCS